MITKPEKNAVVLANKAFGTLEGKTANDLVIYQGKYKVVAIIDEDKVGQDAGEVLNLGHKNIPIVANLEDSLQYKPQALVIGIAPPGGRLPNEWHAICKNAIKNGLDIVSGLHFFFGDDPEYSELAKQYNVQLIDIRKPPAFKKVLTGTSREVKTPRITFLSTDAAAGKNIAMFEFLKEARKRGYKAGMVLTGQTMIMIGGGPGACVDALPADFMSGTVEKMVEEVAAENVDLIFVEGQGSLSHPAYGQESLAILYGAWPTATFLVHPPFRKIRDGYPRFTVPTPQQEIRMIETVCPGTKVLGIVVNGADKSDEEVKQAIKKLEKETGLPANDALRFNVENLFDALEAHLKKK